MQTELKQTHTAGPWKSEPWSYENGKRVVITIQTDKDAIAQVCDLWPPDEREGEKQANINLLKTAPQLLAACKKISAAPYGVAIGDLEFLNAAIAKAEGR